MPRVRTFSPQTFTVLEALSHRPADWLYGLEIAKLTGLKSGSLYPILIRLADRGLLKSRWLSGSSSNGCQPC
jgi:PadR family transcriptional regulator PadR